MEKKRDVQVAPVVRVVEGIICIGMLAMWAGLLNYHFQHTQVTVPKGLPRKTPVKAILRMTPPLDDASFFLIVIGAAVAGSAGFLALIFIKSKQKSKYIGMYASFALTVSAWHLFRIEGEETLDRYKSANGTKSVDLWAPITSNLVLLFMSMLLMHHNLLIIPMYEHLPRVQGLMCRLSVMVGVVCAQIYFTIMILVNYIVGLVLLSSSIFLILFGYLGGQIWEYLLIQKEKKLNAEVSTPLTIEQI